MQENEIENINKQIQFAQTVGELSDTDFMVIEHIGRNGPSTLKNICAELNVSKSTMSYRIERLVQKDILLKKSTFGKDKPIEFTDTGKQIFLLSKRENEGFFEETNLGVERLEPSKKIRTRARRVCNRIKSDVGEKEYLQEYDRLNTLIKKHTWEDLHRLTENKNVIVRRSVVDAFCLAFPNIPDKQQAWIDMIRLVHDEDSKVQSLVIKNLGPAFSYVPDKAQAWVDLHRLAQDARNEFRRSATDAIGSAFADIPDKQQAWTDLIRLAQDIDRNVRLSAVYALGSAFPFINNKEQAWTDLTRLAQDMDSDVRAYANHSMGRVRISEAIKAENEENFKDKLENAIEFFQLASKEAVDFHPANFCLPFYRLFYTIIFGKQQETEIQRYLVEAKHAIEGSEIEAKLIEAIENLTIALNEAQKAQEMNINGLKSDLNAYKKYCKRVEDLLDITDEMAPSATKLIRKGLPKIDESIKRIIDENKMALDLRVFVSSTIEELKNERQAAIKAINEINLIPVNAENFDPNNKSPSEVYLTNLKNSDLVVFILDRKYSSHVENEYALAYKYEKPVFFFIRERDKEERDTILNSLISNISRECILIYYLNNEELNKVIKRAILRYLMAQVRNIEKVDYSKAYDLSRPIKDQNLILLGHTINPKFERFPVPTYWRKTSGELVAIFDSGVLHIPTNIGTHVDFPNHLAFSPFIIRNYFIDDNIESYKGKCITLDCSEIIFKRLSPFLDSSGYLEIRGKDEKEQNEYYLNIINSLKISLDYFREKLAQDFGIESLSYLNNYFVLFYTGLDKYWSTEIFAGQEWKYAYFLNPFLAEDLMDELVKSQIKGIGSDTYRLENPILNLSRFQSIGPFSKKTSLPEVIQNEIDKINEKNLMHYKFLSSNILIIENLTNLEQIKNKISLFLALPPRIMVHGANTDMFVRAIAFEIKNPQQKI